MWVKICANTSVEDALKAVELGADAVGFVFAPSVRRVTAEQVAKITAALPVGVERVGVFGAVPAEEIAEAVEVGGLTAVQLHGGLDRGLTRGLRELLRPETSIIQSVHWVMGEDDESAERLRRQMRAIAEADPQARVLVDTKAGGASGGTGKTFNWQRAREVLASQPGLRVIVAGGLRPENVAEAIGELAPWGVDVASGVEREPGRKDSEKLKAFIENARRA